MSPDQAMLHAYDFQLRGAAEMVRAGAVTRLGPLWLGVFDGSAGFITYRDLGGVEGIDLDHLIDDALAHFGNLPQVDEVEWKTRGHDAPDDLPERLVAHGFAPDEVETVMVGEASGLAADVPLPDGVVIRRAGEGADLAADAIRALDLQNSVFDRPGGSSTDSLVQELAEHSDLLSLWLAEADGSVVCAGRLAIVEDTDFAGLWGGATDPEWRRRGIYRALTAARARHAIASGVTYLQSDCSAMSRPILERNGLQPITTTTPYRWRRG